MKRWLIKFPRLNQLYERIGTSKPDNVLAGYIRRGEFEPLVQKHAELFDQILTQLDSNAWEDLIVKVLPYSYSKDKSRGWHQFWNHLNESRGYVLLKKRGYSDVKFIPPEKTVKGKNEQFADLEGMILGVRWRDKTSRGASLRVFARAPLRSKTWMLLLGGGDQLGLECKICFSFFSSSSFKAKGSRLA